MNDAYTPAMTALVLTPDEQSAVTAALAKAKPWDDDNDLIKSVKTKIRTHHLARHDDTCCYCRTILHGAGHFMIDREHILPKGNATYKPYSFATWNLSISCKRCNMQFKGEDDGFVVDKINTASFTSSSNYLLLHPNFDPWDQHLCRDARQINTKYVVKYTLISTSPKGQYTYDYFDLKGLEIDSFDAAQGVMRAASGSESESVAAARQIAAVHGQ
jgi:hypothetical protein